MWILLGIYPALETKSITGEHRDCASPLRSKREKLLYMLSFFARMTTLNVL